MKTNDARYLATLAPGSPIELRHGDVSDWTQDVFGTEPLDCGRGSALHPGCSHTLLDPGYCGELDGVEPFPAGPEVFGLDYYY